MYGKIRFYNDKDSRLAAVGFLTKQIEKQTHGDKAWKMADAPLGYIMEQIENIVAFDVTITKVLAKSKLSQNDTKSDVEGIIESLKVRGEEAMAEVMQERLSDSEP